MIEYTWYTLHLRCSQITSETAIEFIEEAQLN